MSYPLNSHVRLPVPCSAGCCMMGFQTCRLIIYYIACKTEVFVYLCQVKSDRFACWLTLQRKRICVRFANLKRKSVGKSGEKWSSKKYRWGYWAPGFRAWIHIFIFFLISLNPGRRPAAGDFGACNARRQAYEMSRRGSVRDTNAHLAIWTKAQIPRTSENLASVDCQNSWSRELLISRTREHENVRMRDTQNARTIEPQNERTTVWENVITIKWEITSNKLPFLSPRKKLLKT